MFDEKGLTKKGFEVFDVLMFLKCLMKKGFEVFGVFKVFDEKGFRSV